MADSDRFERDLALLQEMFGTTSRDEAMQRAVTLTAELVRHNRKGGTIILGTPGPWWRGPKRERLRFTDFEKGRP